MSETTEDNLTGWGWITPKGKILHTQAYGHFEVLKKEPVLQDLWVDAMDTVNSVWVQCDQLEKSGEHPEWHVYDIQLGTAKAAVISKAFELGYIRFGLSRMQEEVSFEGTHCRLRKRSQLLWKLLDEYNDLKGVDYTLDLHRIKL